MYSQAWLQVAEVYLAQDLCDEAELCILEASQLQPLSTTVLYMVGADCISALSNTLICAFVRIFRCIKVAYLFFDSWLKCDILPRF